MCEAGHCLQCCPAAPRRFAAPATPEEPRSPALRSLPNRGQHFVKEPWRRAMPAVKPVPDGYPSLTPYLIVADAAAAIAFYQQVFGATLRMKLDGPDGKIGHAELEIGNSLIMLADEHPEMGALSPKTVGGTPVGLHVYVEDV